MIYNENRALIKLLPFQSKLGKSRKSSNRGTRHCGLSILE